MLDSAIIRTYVSKKRLNGDIFVRGKLMKAYLQSKQIGDLSRRIFEMRHERRTIFI